MAKLREEKTLINEHNKTQCVAKKEKDDLKKIGKIKLGDSILFKNSKTNVMPDVFVKNELKETESLGYTNGSPIEEKIIKNFTDLLILKHIQKKPLISGYEILNYLRRKFDVPFSPGTIYSTLYSLERHGLIKNDGNEIGRTYELTNEGRKMMDGTTETRKRIQQVLVDIAVGE